MRGGRRVGWGRARVFHGLAAGKTYAVGKTWAAGKAYVAGR